MFTGLAIALAVLAVLVGFLGQAGIEVDGSRYAWRNYFKFMGLTVGRWKALPPITGVVIKYFRSKTSPTPGTISSLANWNNTSSTDEELIIMLSVASSRNGIKLRAVGLPELRAAQAYAQDLAKELQVPVHEFLPPSLAT